MTRLPSYANANQQAITCTGATGPRYSTDVSLTVNNPEVLTASGAVTLTYTAAGWTTSTELLWITPAARVSIDMGDSATRMLL